ncbi:MXAN_5187 family protein [Pajaroellobacter abortibovis]|uniref:Double Cache domain-containing protein n=1 Tax=Pajaroellobacter abortibovis TaxID=1882918 RepID=A0A1L6MWF6_9BACT|nr:MXAN_5187 family protein [Pajaroellobacter abortibovis]APR99856.1 hypothetical protein BCY86_03570 [Pajaroellobacter abortibovis]
MLFRLWLVLLLILLGFGFYTWGLEEQKSYQGQIVWGDTMLASDSQRIEWLLQLETRRRLDALVVGSLDRDIQQHLMSANVQPHLLPNTSEGFRQALEAVQKKFPPEFQKTGLVIVDRQGRIVAHVDIPFLEGKEEGELGGYPAVYDALHGYARDDVWIFDHHLFWVVVRPVEFDITQPPVGAVLGLTEVDEPFVASIAQKTHVAFAFYADQRILIAHGFQGRQRENGLDHLLERVLKGVEEKEDYRLGGRSGVVPLGSEMKGIFTRLTGEAWHRGGGFVVIRPQVQKTPYYRLLEKLPRWQWQADELYAGLFFILLGIGGITFALLFFEFIQPVHRLKRGLDVWVRKGWPPSSWEQLRGVYRNIARSFTRIANGCEHHHLLFFSKLSPDQWVGQENPAWRPLYEEFLVIRHQCGEPTQGLTFGEFCRALYQEQALLMAKYRCQKVLFSSSIQNGRAVLKAVPSMVGTDSVER